MAKRARGAPSRPGQRRATQRSGPRPTTATPAPGAASPPPAPVEAAPGDAAVAAAGPRTPTRNRVRPASVASDAFVAEETEEYRYVVADVRRIVVVAAGMFGIMAVLFVLIDLTGAVHL